MGQFGEHLDEAAMGQAVSQKQLGQQQVAPSGAAAAAAGQKAQAQAGMPGAGQPPRELGTLGDELIKRPIKDIWHEIKAFFSLNTWLGINPNTQDPAKQQKMAAVHKRYQQLDAEQQEVAKQQYQQELQRKKAEEEEKARKEQAAKQQEQQSIAMPSSPQKGPVGPSSGKSKKSNAIAKMTQQRQTMSQAQGAD